MKREKKPRGNELEDGRWEMGMRGDGVMEWQGDGRQKMNKGWRMEDGGQNNEGCWL